MKRQIYLIVALIFTLYTFAFGQLLETKLTASDSAPDDEFGVSVSISNNYIVVGAPGNDALGNSYGSAYVFMWNGSAWIQQKKLVGDDANETDYFGNSVSIFGDYVIVGAEHDTYKSGWSPQGSAYIFKKDGNTWNQQTRLIPNDTTKYFYFGQSVSISYNYAIIGAYYMDNSGGRIGSVYIFKRDESNWTQLQKVTASDGAAGDQFGQSVAISGDYAIIGAHGNDNKGAAYIFKYTGANYNWVEKAKLIASDGRSGAKFGYSVSISGIYAIVGADEDDNENGSWAGAAYIFKRDVSSDNWIQIEKLLASDGAEYDHFGCSVSISGELAIVGSEADDDNGSASGSVYIFEWNGSKWNEMAKLTASDGVTLDYFGNSVSISSNYAIVGANAKYADGNNTGSAYVYIKESWGEGEIKLTTPNGGEFWQQSTTKDIIWGGDIISNIKIDLYQGGSKYREITNSTESDGNYNWSIPTNISDGSNYKIRITSTYYPNLYDESDNFFTLDNTDPVAPSNFSETHGVITDIWQNSVNNPSFNWVESSDLSGIAKYYIYLGDNAIGTATTDSTVNPAYSTTVSSGIHYLRIKPKDNAGNLGTWTNGFIFKYDNMKPSGASASSPDTSETLNFSVNFSTGTDIGGSGISGNYNVKVKKDTDDWQDWLTNYAGNIAQYNGEHDHTYAFEAAAIDNAGNTEEFTGTAETKTVVDTTAAIPTVVTGSVTDLTSTSATLKGTANPNNLQTIVKFEYGIDNSYGSEIKATPSPISGTSVVDVSAQVINLSPNTTYHYRVVATSSGGTSHGNDREFKTDPHAPLVSTGVAENITTNSAILNGKVTPYIENTAVTFEYGTNTSYGNVINAVPYLVSGINEISVTGQLTNLTPNKTYYFRVVAENTSGTSYGDPQLFTTYFFNMYLNNTVNFPSHENVKDFRDIDYRIIGLPGDNDFRIDDIISGTYGRDWKAFWDNGNPSTNKNDYLDKFDGSAKFEFSVGRAFWILKKDPLIINKEITATQLDVTGSAYIPLNDGGWTLITNPFHKPIEWAKIQAVNGNFSEPIWSYYNGAFDTSSNFYQNEGYYFDNTDTKLSSLKIPWGITFFTPSLSKKADETGWRVSIELTVNHIVDKTVAFGVSTEASLTKDNFDFRKPRAIANISTVYFNRPEWDPNYSIFATDIRPEFGKMESWDFEVRATHQKNSKLAFNGIEDIPIHFEVFLIDEGRGKIVNIREQPFYTFIGIGEFSKFRVVVGESEAVKEKLNEVILPTQFYLGNNYPNPFNESTMIPIAVPVASDLEVKVFNILGKTIKTLYSGSIESGRYWFQWDGKDEGGNNLASGVYLYRLSTDKSVIQTKKMMFIK